MKLFTFGDSWTSGQGCNVSIENTFTDDYERKVYRNNMSWPKYLSEILNIEFSNLSETGSSNKQIFDKIIETIKSNTISENDLVIIMWSSSLRDELSFFPKNEWHIWGKDYTNENWKFNGTINSILSNIKPIQYTKNPEYNLFLKKYKEFYITNLYNQTYYNIINQNYILFIQELFKFYNIKYVFCDAFDLMIDLNIKLDIDNTQFINKKNYYQFGKLTLKDYLISLDFNNLKLWEDSLRWGNVPGKHPNSNGYKEIAKELHNFILESNLLFQNNKKDINLI